MYVFGKNPLFECGTGIVWSTSDENLPKKNTLLLIAPIYFKLLKSHKILINGNWLLSTKTEKGLLLYGAYIIPTFII